MSFNRLMVGVSAAVVCVAAAGINEARADQPEKEFDIAVGETLTFPARGVSGLFVGSSKTVNAQRSADGRVITVTGLEPGVTTINFNTSQGRKTVLVRVVEINPESLAEEVREILGPRSGVEVKVVKGRVLLEGEVASETFKKRIEQLVKLYPNQVLNFTSYRESFVEGAKLVAVELDFVQLATTDRDQLGVKWGQFFGANASFGNGAVPLYYGGEGSEGAGVLPSDPPNPARLPRAVSLTGGSGFVGYYSLVGNLNAALDFLTEQGVIKTRQHGIIVTEAGTEGEYLSGGELLVRVIGGVGGQATLERVEYGLKLKVTPIVDIENRVKMKLVTEFSELDFSNAVDEIPSLRKVEATAVVNMQEGQSVLVSGLTSTSETSTEAGWWLLGKIPILGWLFKSRNYLHQRLDNALFVTPRIYEPGGKSHNTLVRGVFEDMLKSGMDPTELPKLSNAPVTSGGSGSDDFGD